MPRSPSVDPDAALASQVGRGRTRAFVLEERYASSDGPWHAHRSAQLVHAAEGVLVVRTKEGRWVVPPERALWIPSRVLHSVSSARPFRLLTLYVKRDRRPKSAPLDNEGCRVVAVDRLVAELLQAAAAFGPRVLPGTPEARLVAVILDRLPALAVAPLLHLAEPTSPALAKIARAIHDDPADDRSLGAWAHVVGLSERTAARRFVAETGTTFGSFRKHVRMLVAIERLAAGESVTQIAFEVGYLDVSSFIAAFKATMGVTPRRYFR